MARGLRVAAAIFTLVACGSGAGSGTRGGDAGAAGDDSLGSAGDMSTTSGGDGGTQSGGGSDGNASGAGGQPDEPDPNLPTKVCSSSMPFGAAQPLEALNTTGHEAGPRLTPDELTIAYLCNDGDARVCLAQRASVTADFEPLLEAVSAGGGVPWLSDDGLVLFYEDDSSLGLYFTQRDATSELFAQGRELTELAGFGDPYVIGGANGRLYLSLMNPPDLYVAQLTDWQPGEPQLVPGASTDDRDVRPVLTPDELTLYFGAGSSLDIWVKERASRSQAFGDPVNVAELNTTEDEFPGWISPDGCRLYFDSGAAPRDLYVAEREH